MQRYNIFLNSQNFLAKNLRISKFCSNFAAAKLKNVWNYKKSNRN